MRSPRVPRLALASHSQHEHGIDVGHVTVQGDVASRAAADDQFPAFPLCRPSDERVALQDGNRRDDVVHAGCGVLDLVGEQVIEDAPEVVCDFERKFDARDAQRASLRAAGRLAFLPATRSSRYRRISGQGIVFPEAAMPA